MFAPLAGWLSDRFGSRLLCSIGAAIIVVGQYLIASLTLQSSVFQLVLPQILIGLGWALFNSPNQSAIMSAVSRDKVGAASGMTVTTARIGGAIGIALSARHDLCLERRRAHARADRIAGKLERGAGPVSESV